MMLLRNLEVVTRNLWWNLGDQNVSSHLSFQNSIEADSCACKCLFVV
jgi:hypothetical protein